MPHKKIVAIIPARGGSVGIPHKNIIDFCGKPLIAWSIEQALAAKPISSVWVSSDSDEILSVASQFGAQTIKRPDNLSGSLASSESAWLHAIETIENQGSSIDLVLAMQATSPLRETKDVESAIEQFEEKGCDSLFSAAELEDFLIWRQEKEGLASLNYDYQNRGRRQDRKPEYVENGSFYLFKPDILREYNNRLGGKIGLSLMDFWKSFEIDTQEDLELCQSLFEKKRLSVKEKCHV